MSYNFRLEIQKFLLYTVNTYSCKCDHCWMGADAACQVLSMVDRLFFYISQVEYQRLMEHRWFF